MKTTLVLLIILSILILLYIILNINKTKDDFKNRNSKINKKISFCFLIYDKINNEELWYNYFKKIDPDKYNIYIHYKKDTPLKYLDKFKLSSTVDTCWGCLSIVLAQNHILKEAIKDPNNQHFIWLSQACIPLKPFNYIYNTLDTTKSYFNLFPDSDRFPRANNLLKYISKDKIKKAAMPSVINRKHAELFIYNEWELNNWFKNIKNVDELAYITLLHYYNLEEELVLTDFMAADSVVFAPWVKMKNYKPFKKSGTYFWKIPTMYYKICQEELAYLIDSKSLFARKFIDNCSGLESLLDKLSQHKYY